MVGRCSLATCLSSRGATGAREKKRKLMVPTSGSLSPQPLTVRSLGSRYSLRWILATTTSSSNSAGAAIELLASCVGLSALRSTDYSYLQRGV